MNGRRSSFKTHLITTQPRDMKNQTDNGNEKQSDDENKKNKKNTHIFSSLASCRHRSQKKSGSMFSIP